MSVWKSREGDPNVMEASRFLQMNGGLWAMGDFASGIAWFDLASDSSVLYDRPGDGPNEFRKIRNAAVHPSKDTLVVVQQSRVSYITSSAREARSIPAFAPRSGFILLDDGSFVISTHAVGSISGARGFTLHQVSSAGEHLRSFRKLRSEEAPKADYWPIARGTEARTFWLVTPHPRGFSVEKWDATQDHLIARFDLTPSWWRGEPAIQPHYESMAMSGSTIPPMPSGVNDVFDGGDVLWIAARHADHKGATSLEETSNDAWFDGVLLALSRTSGEVIAATAFDQFIAAFTNEGLAVLYAEHDTGEPSIELVRPSLKAR
ncbi:MAG: hypothetical protein WEB88_07590 [Gemmatimonadota bacterium]